MAADLAMRSMVNVGNMSKMARPIPKRGRVKVAILVGLAHSVASIFSLHATRRSTSAAKL